MFAGFLRRTATRRPLSRFNQRFLLVPMSGATQMSSIRIIAATADGKGTCATYA